MKTTEELLEQAATSIEQCPEAVQEPRFALMAIRRGGFVAAVVLRMTIAQLGKALEQRHPQRGARFSRVIEAIQDCYSALQHVEVDVAVHDLIEVGLVDYAETIRAAADAGIDIDLHDALLGAGDACSKRRIIPVVDPKYGALSRTSESISNAIDHVDGFKNYEREASQ